MGFFSWKCAKTGKPILADMGKDDPWRFASEVVLLLKNGSVIRGRYDGYGRVDGFSLDEYNYNPDEFRLVISRYYDGETFDQLPKNEDEPNQGYFWGVAELNELFDGEQHES